MNSAKTPVTTSFKTRLLTAVEFQRLAELPPEAEWFRNIRSPATKRAYENAVRDFMLFAGINRPEEFRGVTRAHVIAWRDELGDRVLPNGESLSGTTIRHRLAALSSLDQYLCDRNAVTQNPVKGVKRPRVETEEGKTPALGYHQARKLLKAPDEQSLKGIRDRAILATLLYHGLSRDELYKLKVRDYKHERRGVPHLTMTGKGEKIRYVPLHGIAGDLIDEYLGKAGHDGEHVGALFRLSVTAVGGIGRKRSRPMASTSSSGIIRRSWASRSALTRCAPRPRRMPSITRRILPRSRSGLATPTSRQHGFMTIGRRDQKTVRRSKSPIRQNALAGSVYTDRNNHD
jgi:site-specific recombinase XerD